MKTASDKFCVFDFLQNQDSIFHSVEGDKQALWLNYILFLSDKQNKYQPLSTTLSICFLGERNKKP